MEIVSNHGGSGNPSAVGLSIQDLDQFFRQVDRDTPAGDVVEGSTGSGPRPPPVGGIADHGC